MRKMKQRKGFTIVELLIVIGVIAILSVTAIIAYSGMQANARRSVLRTDANNLVGALNNFNASGWVPIAPAGGPPYGTGDVTRATPVTAPHTVTSVTPGSGEVTVFYIIPARGTMGRTEFSVTFQSQAHFNRAVSFLEYNAPAGMPDQARFSVHTTHIGNSDGRSRRTSAAGNGAFASP